MASIAVLPRVRRQGRDGAGWSKRSNEGREYLSVKLDDPSFTQPSFTQPICANLFDVEDGAGYSLIWSRSRKASAE